MTCKIDVFKTVKSYAGYTLVVAFPSTGLVGVIAAKHLVDKLKADLGGCVRSDLFAPIALIQDGVLLEPVRVYVDSKHKLVILTSEQILHKLEALHEFSDALAAWIRTSKFKQVFSLSGILVSDEESQRNKVYGVGVNKESVAVMKKWDIEVLKEGISTRISPLILMEFSHSKIPAVQLLGEIKYNRDYTAAAAVVKKLSEMLNLKVDTTKLKEEAANVSQKLDKQIVNLEQAKKKFADKPEEHSLIYG
ncbi:MAG: proteasome assembly chaperone family protein [Candidatus Diapherotrites archaeon]|nr:proteasome assembly chaperone family protein [Candidatus Diapherotrites archaeon]